MSDDKESTERDEIIKNDEERFTDVDEESEEIDKIKETKEDDLEPDQSATYERYQIENPELFKRIDSQKRGDNDAPVDTDIDLETNVMKNTELSKSHSVAI